MIPNKYTLGVSISSSQGGGNHPPQESVLQKRVNPKKAQEDEGYPSN